MGRRHYRVTWADAIRVHHEALDYGGAQGVINEHAIRSALGRPYHGHHRLIHQKAAALVHGIVAGHGFTDGNKRTALYLMELLIQRSGFELIEDNDLEVADVITSVARSDMDYDELAHWFRDRIVRLSD